MFENASTCHTCISPEKDTISSLVYHDSMIQVVISNPVTLSIIHFHPYLFFHLYADLFFANLLIITLSLSLVFLFLPCNCLLHHVEDYAMNFWTAHFSWTNQVSPCISTNFEWPTFSNMNILYMRTQTYVTDTGLRKK